jgi:hypothetical protein
MIETSLKDIQKFFPREVAILGGRWDYLIANENKKLPARDFSIIKVKEVQIPPNSIVIPIMALKRHKIDVVDLLISEKPGIIDSVIVYSETEEFVESGTLLAILKITPAIPVEKNIILEFFRSLGKLERDMEEKFIKTSWPILW